MPDCYRPGMNNLWGTLLLMLAVFTATTTHAQSTKEYIGAWTVEQSRDLFTDDVSSGAYVKPTQYPALGHNDALVVMCSDLALTSFYGVSVMLDGSTYVSENFVSVERRAGSRPAKTEPWFASRTSLIIHQAPTMAAFIADLLDVETLAVRYTGYADTATYVYPVAGFREVLAALGCYTGPH